MQPRLVNDIIASDRNSTVLHWLRCTKAASVGLMRHLRKAGLLECTEEFLCTLQDAWQVQERWKAMLWTTGLEQVE